MAQIIPIRGIRYTARVGDLSAVLAPPYDVVDESEQRELLSRSPHNALHLELPEGDGGRYAAAAEALRAWTQEGVLARDSEPMIYVYEQRFVEAGIEHVRRCVMVGVEAQPWEEGAVTPHEFTMSGPKEDRLKLLQATGVQFSPLLMIARDRAGRLRGLIDRTVSSPPSQEGTVAGETHRLWAVQGDSLVRKQLAPLSSESFYIADGHHRYETAVTYKTVRLRDEGSLPPSHPARFVLAGIVAADDPGLLVRPIHRVIPRKAPAAWRRTVGEAFDIQSVPAGDDPAAAARDLLEERPGAIVAAGLEQDSLQVLSVRDPDLITSRAPRGYSGLWANLQPNVVRYGLLEPLWQIDDAELRAGAVTFTHNERAALATAGGDAGVAFLVHSVSVADVLTLADRGERMPQKSTFFHPKLGTGLVLHPLND